MFNITCSGATLSKNKDFFAVGDFTGHIKVFKAEDPRRASVFLEAQISD